MPEHTPKAATGSQEPRCCDPVGVLEIADRLGVKRQTARMWRTRHLLPEPQWTVSGLPCWNWQDVAEWAEKSGRLPAQEAAGNRRNA